MSMLHLFETAVKTAALITYLHINYITLHVLAYMCNIVQSRPTCIYAYIQCLSLISVSRIVCYAKY